MEAFAGDGLEECLVEEVQRLKCDREELVDVKEMGTDPSVYRHHIFVLRRDISQVTVV